MLAGNVPPVCCREHAILADITYVSPGKLPLQSAPACLSDTCQLWAVHICTLLQSACVSSMASCAFELILSSWQPAGAAHLQAELSQPACLQVHQALHSYSAGSDSGACHCHSILYPPPGMLLFCTAAAVSAGLRLPPLWPQLHRCCLLHWKESQSVMSARKGATQPLAAQPWPLCCTFNALIAVMQPIACMQTGQHKSRP